MNVIKTIHISWFIGRQGAMLEIRSEIFQRAVHIHPTVSEPIPTMLGELQPLPEQPTAK